MPEISNIKLKLNKENILKRLGYKEKVDERTNNEINKQINESYSLIDIKAVYKDFDVNNVDNEGIKLGSFDLIKSKNLAKIMKNASRATMIALTIGDKIEQKTNDILIDTIRDVIGSEAVETLANEINKRVTLRAKGGGYKTLFRFSVGYGGWDIKDQKKILDVLEVDFIDLNENSIMHPKKSITALIGWQQL